jgi:Bacterial Ig domain
MKSFPEFLCGVGRLAGRLFGSRPQTAFKSAAIGESQSTLHSIPTLLNSRSVATLAVICGCVSVNGQTLLDSFADGNFSASPAWGGNTTLFTVVANSDAAAGATGSQTLRLNTTAVSATDYLSTQIASWGNSQEWGVWIGRRAQAFTAANQQYVWLYANEATLNNATVDGYRLAIGDDAGGDEIRLEYVVNGALSATVITSSGSFANGATDVGILVRVTRSSSGAWVLTTSTVPASGNGAIATDVPNAANCTVSQGSATHNTLVPAANGYLGVAALHSTGANAIIGAEWDQFYFTIDPSTPTATAATSVTSGGFSANWNAASGAAGYRLDVSTATDFSSFVTGYNNLDVGNVTTYAVSGLSGGTAYHYRVRATNSAGASASSSTIDVTTSAGATPKITVTLPGQSSANTGAATAQTAGTAFNITLTATTDGTTTDTSVNTSKSIIFTGPTGSPSYPGTVSFSSGVGTANITLTAAETTTITASNSTDSVGGTASSSLTVNPGAINSYVVTAASPQTAGNAFNVTVTAKDANNNTVTTDSSTVVTMTSGGSVQFDSNGDSTFGDNTKPLASGTFTISVRDNVAETTTVTATDANSKTGTSGSIVVNPIPIYRSKADGVWNTTVTWEYSTDGGASWANAVSTPTSLDGTITILHLVTNTASVTVDQVVITNGGTLALNTAFTVSNGTGDDIDVLTNGVFVLTSTGVSPSFNSGSTAKIEPGGILRVAATGVTANGAGVNGANFVYTTGSILDFAISSTFSASGVTYFPNADATTVPVFRVSLLGGNPGGGNATIVNGILEAVTNITWTGAGAKVFRNGVRGIGNVTQSTAGLIVISGATAELGGLGTLALGASGLLITNGSTVTLSSDKALAGAGALTNAGTLDLNGKNLTNTTAPVLIGTLLTGVDRNGGSPLAGKIVLSSGTLSFGGTLTVTNTGATLTGGEVFDLLDAGAFSGSFTVTNLPTLGGGLNWYAGNLGVNGTLTVNRAPTAGNTTSNCTPGLSTIVQITGAGGLTGDADGNTLTIALGSSPTQGTNLLFTAGGVSYIYYQNTNAAAGSDSFGYTVSDGKGGTASGTITINVVQPNGQTLNSLAAPEVIGAGPDVRLKFLGIPGYSYALEETHDLTPPITWTIVLTNIASGNGLISFTNTPSGGSDFYRTRWVP